MSLSTTFRIGQGTTKISNGTAIVDGVTVGKVNGGIGISSPVGSATLTRSSYHHSSSGIGSSASIASNHSHSFHKSSSIVNGGYSGHSTIIESGVSTLSAGSVTEVAVTGAQMFAEATKKEKEEMQRLNDHLSNYIARVKHLEEQNRLLVTSLTELRGKWNSKNDGYKSTYVVSSSTVRDDKFAVSKARIAKDVQHTRVTTEIADYRAKTEELYRLADVDRKRVPQWRAAIFDADSELANMNKRLDDLRTEERMALNEQERLRKELGGLYEQLDIITVDKLSYQSQLQSIREEINFFKTVHEEEVRELQRLLVVAPADTKEFFRNEIALAVRDIRKEYQLLATAGKTKLESWYKSKVHSIQELVAHRGDSRVVHLEQVKKINSTMTELHTRYTSMEQRNQTLEFEVRKLQKQVDEDHLSYEKVMAEYDNMLIRMREECATLVTELQSLLDSKVIMDGEIAIYRAMIDGEQRRVGIVVKKVEDEHADQWEVATKTKFSTVVHGNVAIVQTEPTGRFVVITNNSDYVEERIGGWSIKRIIDNGREMTYHFPAGCTIKPRQKIRIFASEQGSAGPDSLVFAEEKSWGMGANITTALYNAVGEEKSLYTQRTVLVHG